MSSIVARLICRSLRRNYIFHKFNAVSVTQIKRLQSSKSEVNDREYSWASDLVNSCSENEKQYLLQALQNIPNNGSEPKDIPPVTLQQLRLAAGIGNLISDLCGLGLVGYVERYAALFGAKCPPLTDAQLKSKRVHRYSVIGRMFGITLGCLLGMVPLLFFPGDETEIEDKKTVEECIATAVNKTSDN